MFDIIAIDWGSKRIGLAKGSSSSKLVIPIEPINNNQVEIIDLIRTLKNKKVILGWPTNFEGGETKITKQINEFRVLLELEQIDVKIYDERGSSQKAKNNAEFTQDKRSINSLAAAEILKDYFNYLNI